MNCAERLVELFGSQAEVARRFRLDRAVVNNWVKSGYVPARWAMEVEHVTAGQVTAVEILNEANARKPVRVKSRPLLSVPDNRWLIEFGKAPPLLFLNAFWAKA